MLIGTAVAALLGGCALPGGTASPARTTAGAAAPTDASGTSSGAAADGGADATDDPQDPARYADHVVRFGREAGVNPQLIMAILYVESYKPHDPQFERSWQKMDPDAAFGVANMHRAAFDDTKRGRPFAHRSWEELPDDPALAVQAQAWYLHDLRRRLPARPLVTTRTTGRLTVDELLALGFNAGPGNMLAFARGVKPGPSATDYLNKLRHDWNVAAEVLPKPAPSS